MVPRGRGRGALQGAPPVTKSSSSYFSYNQSPENPLMDLRITEIIDVTTFWAQVGTAKQLSDFDQFCVSLSAQCEDQETSSHDTPIIVGHIVPVKDAVVPGVWHRARVTRILPSRTVEVHFVDTGRSGRVSISDLCTHMPELTLQIPSQALQCNLDGVTMVQGNDVIREAAIARLSEIVSRPLKTIIHSICDDVFFLSAYTRQKGYWTSVGEILRLKGLAKYTPPGSLTVDHLISPSLLPRETTPPNDYESDSSTLIDIEVSHSLKWSDTKTKTQPSFSVSVPEVAVCNDLVSLSDDEAAVSDSIWLTPPSDESELQSLDFSLMITSVETQLRVSQSSGPFTPTETPPNEVESNSELSLSPPLETTAKPKAFSLASPKLVVPFSSLSQRCDARSNAAANKENKSFIKLPTTSSSVDRESDILQNLENDESGNTKKSDNIQATTTTETNNTATIGQNALDKKDVTSSQRQDTSAIEERDTEEEHETDRSSSVSKENSSAGKQSSSVTKRQSTPSKKVSPDSSRSPTETGHKGNEADSEEESSDDDDDEWDESLLPPRSGGSQPGSNNSTPMNTPEKNPPADEKHYHGSKNRDKFRARFDAVMGGGESSEQRQWKGYRTGGKKYSKRGNNQPWQQNYAPRPRPNNWRAFSKGQNGSFGQNRALGRGARIREDIGGNWSHPSYQDERHQHYRDDFPRGSQYDNSSPRFATPRSEGSNFEHLTQPDKRLEPPSSFAPGPVERGSGESTTTRSVTPKPETRGPGISLEVAAQRAQLSAEAKTKECNWHAWKIENAVQKIISNLTEDTVKEFEQQIQDILDGTSAKTLTDLQYEKKPLTVVFNSVLSQVTMEKADLITEAISIAATNFQGPPAYKILQDAVYTAAEEVSMGSADTFAAKKRGNFCSFAQKLFISASYSGNEEYSRCIGLSLKRCLKSWINCSTQVPKVEQLACAECFVALCDNIGPTLDAFSKESLDEYFNGPVRESILCNDSPREVKEKLLDLSFRRVGNWGGAKPQKPSEEVASPTSQSSSEPPFTNCSQPTQATSPVPPALQPPSNMVQKVTPLSPDILQQQSSHQHASSPPFPSAFPQQMFLTPPNVQSLSSQQPGPLSPPAVLQSPFDSNQQFSRSMLGYPSPVGLERRGVFSSQHFARNQELFSPHYYVNSQQSSATPSLPQPPQQQPDICEPEDGDPYRHTLEMLETLGFPELLPNFKQHMLRDFVFDLDKDMTLIKECLTSAQLPLGAVVGIMSFLENKRKMKQRKPPTLRPNNHIPNSPLQSPYQFDVRPSPQAMLPQLMPPTPHLQAYCLPPVQPFMQAGMNYAAPNPVTPTSTVIVTQASVPQTLPITLPAAEVSAAHLPSPDGAATTAEADSSGGLTVRRPSSHRNWHKPEPEPPKDGVHSNSKPQVGGGFGKFSCVLCHSNEHSTMTCDHRDRFFVHM